MFSSCRHLYHSWARQVRRITTSGEIIPEIDGLRFLAIAGVFFHHVVRFVTGQREVTLAEPVPPDTLTRVLDAGSYGVQLFFVISGFVLGLPFAVHYLKGGHRPELRKYYLRRV